MNCRRNGFDTIPQCVWKTHLMQRSLVRQLWGFNERSSANHFGIALNVGRQAMNGRSGDRAFIWDIVAVAAHF